MDEKSYCVFGRIDVFSVLRYMVTALGVTLALDWAFFLPEVSKVRNITL